MSDLEQPLKSLAKLLSSDSPWHVNPVETVGFPAMSKLANVWESNFPAISTKVGPALEIV